MLIAIHLDPDSKTLAIKRGDDSFLVTRTLMRNFPKDDPIISLDIRYERYSNGEPRNFLYYPTFRFDADKALEKIKRVLL
ncbi:MAG TPA: hypothetical protein DCX32_02420 [Candidatus Moranbacteria bacterium]|nr:MAG: hypothetical protein UW95_C0019G0009 [Parcubacteria group bacterium GW2011_GWC1_45_14]HAV11375.1 hypothetical protein [Candidatus Moranbacteria bacterium]